MKYAVALLLVVASISANAFVAPRNSPAEEHVLNAIEVFKQFIARFGLDNLDIADETVEWALPVPELLTAIGKAVDVKFYGLTDIEVRQLSYNPATSTLNINFGLDYIHFSSVLAQGIVKFFDRIITGELTGSLHIRGVTFDVDVTFDGLEAKSATVKFDVESIVAEEPRLTIEGQDSYDLSEVLDRVVNTRIPRGIDNFKDEINELLGIYVVWYLNRVLEIDA